MGKHKKRNVTAPAPARPLPLKWVFAPDVPTEDFFECMLPGNPDEPVECFVDKMERGEFLAWEAVVATEQNLPLTRKQRAALNELLNFGDEDDAEERILYIDEIARPTQPWYEILRRVAASLLVEPFDTREAYYAAHTEGWDTLVRCLEEHADGLTLPPGIATPVEVVPADLRLKLDLQTCFDSLAGLGQYEELTLENEEQQDRIDEFIERLRERRPCVEVPGLTLESLLTKVVLPERDRTLLITMLTAKLRLESARQPLADAL